MIKVVLFDLDDTLVDTHRVFKTILTEIRINMSQQLNIPIEKVRQLFSKYLKEAYEQFAVSPQETWEYVISQFQNSYTEISQEAKEQLIERINEIYKTIPEVKQGVLETLKYIKKKNIPIGLVTHASVEWTNFKLDNTGLRPYFDNIVIVDTHRHKSSQDWLKGFQNLSFQPQEGCIVGDNIKGDIIAGHEINTKQLFWVNNAEYWSVYSQGDIPKETVVIQSIDELQKYL